ncbi:hypothetical protein [Micromonospora sp. CB01531]|uniref:hypothetical protein n=1 Tax=Micromonospora sp. CB01531 TaxID=1718947 RepID=UPI00093A5E04|nr:hypothetical protein [Micromonospora sp. CB01531]OKI54669.1 hypothetical protein A6A27_31645 [Micromonospora sp. CB01531]
MFGYTLALVEYYAGVLTLVLLTLTVMAGVFATDRIVLRNRHRVLLQSVHRTLGILAVGAVVLHVMSMITEGHTSAVGVMLPFLGGGGLAVGLGALAVYLMVSVLWTGLIRARFAGSDRPWLWRVLHSGAYISWPAALLHGLDSGRPAAAWVVHSYLGCVLAVVVALLVRLVGSFARSRDRSTSYVSPLGRPARDGAAVPPMPGSHSTKPAVAGWGGSRRPTVGGRPTVQHPHPWPVESWFERRPTDEVANRPRPEDRAGRRAVDGQGYLLHPSPGSPTARRAAEPAAEWHTARRQSQTLDDASGHRSQVPGDAGSDAPQRRIAGPQAGQPGPDRRPALADLPSHRSGAATEAEAASGRSRRKRQVAEELAEEGAYWARLRGEAQ